MLAHPVPPPPPPPPPSHLIPSKVIDGRSTLSVRQRSELPETKNTTESSSSSATAARRKGRRQAGFSSNLIWVPADKHPQLAPNEFAAWIKQHCKHETDTHEHSSSSSLSALLLKYQTDGKATLLNGQDWVPQDRMYIFDRNSTADDDSPVLVPHHSSGSRSLSRRSALSARGKAANKSRWSLRRRSLPDTLHTRYRDDINIRKDNDENDEENGDCNDNAYARWQRKKRVSSVETTQQSVPPEGVRLYDRPVNISEWVDLGRASLDLSKEDPDMFLKLHSAESKMLQSSKKSKGKTATQHAPKESLKSVSSVDETSTRDTKVKRRRSFTLSLPTRKKRSNSASLPSTPSSTTIFNIDKRKKEDQVVSDPEDNKNQRPMSLGARLSRSLSFSRGKKKSRQQANSNQQALKVDDVPATAAFAHKNAEPSFTPAYKSYRLPIQVERAMYRLSHAKLANPCRPLHQQVLISNFMFWYLSLLQNQQHEANIVLFSHPPPPTPPHFVPPPKSLRRKSFTDSLSLNYYKSSYKKQ